MPLRSLMVDFNSYFASVEQQERPELRGRPVAVAPLQAETTFVIAASHSAKRAGVKTGVRVAEARRLCPGLVVVEARPQVYVEYHHRLLAAIETALPLGKVLSIDEVVCDLPVGHTDRAGAETLARRIKAAVAARVGPGLTCSIGIAPNSLLAKVASDLVKPDGLVVIEDHELEERVASLGLRDFSGIGPRMEARLTALGVVDGRSLWDASLETLRAAWGGVEGERFWRRLHGEAVPYAETHRGSVGHEHVLPPDLRDDAAAYAVLCRLLQKAAARLRRYGCQAGLLSVHVRYADRQRWHEDLALDPTQDTLRLAEALRRVWALRPVGRPAPRKVGVCLARLLPTAVHTGSLFEPERERGRGQLWTAVDQLNERYGRAAVYCGSAHRVLGTAPVRIAFNHVPEAAASEGFVPRRGVGVG